MACIQDILKLGSLALYWGNRLLVCLCPWDGLILALQMMCLGFSALDSPTSCLQMLCSPIKYFLKLNTCSLIGEPSLSEMSFSWVHWCKWPEFSQFSEHAAWFLLVHSENVHSYHLPDSKKTIWKHIVYARILTLAMLQCNRNIFILCNKESGGGSPKCVEILDWD